MDWLPLLPLGAIVVLFILIFHELWRMPPR